MPSSASEIDRAEAHASAERLSNRQAQQRVDRFSAGLLALYALAVVNGCAYFQEKGPQLQTTSIALNHGLLVVVLLIPAVVLCLRLTASYTRSAGWITVVMLLITLPPEFMLLGHCIMREPQRRLQSLRTGNRSIGCYRTLSGGFDSYAVEIRQERRIAPGLIWSAVLDREDFTKDVMAKWLDSCRLECTFFTHDGFISESLPRTRTVVLQVR